MVNLMLLNIHSELLKVKFEGIRGTIKFSNETLGSEYTRLLMFLDSLIKVAQLP